ncbi:regulatory protein [uncultured phage cr6_1]|uniref:Regulatory protein n=1 Tax=uncultured phage cr6_1 TaxID=2772085 RepID=A0A7M1RTR3_9CAUD|nr:regulatory protein [uncultured phage cr6_1]QOR57192.1 regulatory protein [uncultured phage cr6_1]
MDKKMTLGGFEAVLDSFIPNPDGGFRNSNIDENVNVNADEFESLDDEELEDIKKNNIEVKNKKEKPVDEGTEEEEIEEEDIEDKPKRKPGRPRKEETIEEEIEEEEGVEDNNEENVVTNFFDAMAEKLNWEFEEDEDKPKSVDELINYFQNVIEENSKPEYSSEEVEALDNFVKQGGDLKKYLTIDAELDLDDIDIEDEANQKLVVKQLLKEKGFSTKKIDKLVSRYEEAGLLEDEAQDALEDLKEIKEERKKQLLEDQKKAYRELLQRQQQFYDNVVSEIKGLKNIRGITVPEKDKKVLMDYILKPDTDGKTKYQKDYAKGGVKNLIESAYFTMNADKLIEAAKREGNNSAIDKFRRSLKSSSITTKSRKQATGSDDDPIWFSAARQLRIS